MSKRKARRSKKTGVGPAAASTSSSDDQGANLSSKLFQPRVLSTFCFATAGLLAGLATGLNHFPDLGQTAEIPNTLLLATYLGDPHPDTAAGLATGFAGLSIGGCLGFSALSDPKILGLSLLVSTFLSITAFTSTGNLWLVGLGFLFGHIPVFMAHFRSKQS